MSTQPICLITGVGGFIGRHLAQYLLAQGAQVYGTYHSDRTLIDQLPTEFSLVKCDFADRVQVKAALDLASWDYVFHFAAQSLPSVSWREAELTFRVNLYGTLYLLDALSESARKPRLILAGSSAEYGLDASLQGAINESAPLTGTSPYGVSKVAAELLSQLYNRTYGLQVVTVRPFFIIGPGKTGDAASDFARGIVALERGEIKSLAVGNLDAIRDFLDVRDAVRALWLLAQRGEPGQAYNVGSGVGHTVKEVLDILSSNALNPILISKDDSRMRPADLPSIVSDCSRLEALGWVPEVPLDRSLTDILTYWRLH